MYYPPMGGPLKCKLKEGGRRIIHSFYKCDVVSTHLTNVRYAKRVYEVSVAFLGKYRTTVSANCRISNYRSMHADYCYLLKSEVVTYLRYSN